MNTFSSKTRLVWALVAGLVTVISGQMAIAQQPNPYLPHPLISQEQQRLIEQEKKRERQEDEARRQAEDAQRRLIEENAERRRQEDEARSEPSKNSNS